MVREVSRESRQESEWINPSHLYSYDYVRFRGSDSIDDVVGNGDCDGLGIVFDKTLLLNGSDSFSVSLTGELSSDKDFDCDSVEFD